MILPIIMRTDTWHSSIVYEVSIDVPKLLFICTLVSKYVRVMFLILLNGTRHVNIYFILYRMFQFSSYDVYFLLNAYNSLIKTSISIWLT